MNRTPFQRRPAAGSRTSFVPPTTPMPWTRAPLPGKSAKQRAKDARRRPVRAAYMESHTMCEYGACLYASTDCHEPWTRARGGPIDDERNMAALCRNHHDWIHHHAEEATMLGWLIPAHQGPAWLEAGGRKAA